MISTDCDLVLPLSQFPVGEVVTKLFYDKVMLENLEAILSAA